MTAYTELEARFRRLGAVEEAIAVLHWDAAAMMPAGGAAARSEQLATLRGIAHQLLTASEIADFRRGQELMRDQAQRRQLLGPRRAAARRHHRRGVPMQHRDRLLDRAEAAKAGFELVVSGHSERRPWRCETM